MKKNKKIQHQMALCFKQVCQQDFPSINGHKQATITLASFRIIYILGLF
jgi:hypothetical protein